jgi:hypothetical protein
MKKFIGAQNIQDSENCCKYHRSIHISIRKLACSKENGSSKVVIGRHEGSPSCTSSQSPAHDVLERPPNKESLLVQHSYHTPRKQLTVHAESLYRSLYYIKKIQSV